MAGERLGKAWHVASVEETAAALGVDPIVGLSSGEAAQRLAEGGANELERVRRTSPWAVLLSQFKNLLIIILLIATALSAFLGHGVEAVAVAVIVLFAVLLGFVQEFRAERAVEALREMAAPNATVLRDGEERDVPARELAPGDVVLLRAGDKVPADLRLADAVNLQIDEAALTGESLPIEKHSLSLADPELPLGDRKNMAYAGTVATYGRGRALVVETGMGTEFGKIARLLQSVETGKTPLQQNLDRVGRVLALAAFALVAVIVGLGLLRGQPVIEMVVFGIALAVAVVPEALPAVVTISLAIGVQRMVKRHALMRRLQAVETLGSTSVICSDKTGTLTKDEMTVRKIYVAGRMVDVTGTGYEPQGRFLGQAQEEVRDEALIALLRAATLASDARFLRGAGGAWEIKGDPTEGALVVAAAKAGLSKESLDVGNPRVGEIPFTSESKRMTTLHAAGGETTAYAKGAPEVLLASCTRYAGPIGETELGDAERIEILEAGRAMADAALRVLAVATKRRTTLESAESAMTFLGLVGMIDPPRPEAKAAIATCEEAGIKPIMITGDHPATARAVARELGLLKAGRVVTGAELEAISDDDLEASAEEIEVYARVSPTHKLRVVAALQKRGHVVAMTGDGVNDAPALKKADIGIAMGITGTDVTKEAADVTLTDDNFASIVAAVEEGRGIFGNIKKYLMYLLSSNIGEIGLMAGATILGLPLPLTAVQLLYVNLATDGLPALALAVDPAEPDIMRRKPRDPKTGIFTRPVVALMLFGGVWSTAVNIALFSAMWNSGRKDEAITMTFVSLILIQFFKAYSFRSDRHSVLRSPFANKWLNLSIVTGVLMLLGIVYIPFLHEPMGTYSLPLVDWGIVLGAAASVLPVLEFGKWLVRRGAFGRLA